MASALEAPKVSHNVLCQKGLSDTARHPNCSWGTEDFACPPGNLEGQMAYKETFWMACDSTEQLRAECGPFHTRAEAEAQARKLGFGFLLRYEHIVGDNDSIQEVRCIFVELPQVEAVPRAVRKLHTRCATCGAAAVHDEVWQA